MKIYMLVGCPGSGKSWVAGRLSQVMDYLPHDNHIKMQVPYLSHILKHIKTRTSTKPILVETPFSISQLKEPLEAHGINVECVFIQEEPGVIEHRYIVRDLKPIPPGHLTRQKTYRDRAKEYGSFSGTSQEVVDYLKSKADNPGEASGSLLSKDGSRP